MANQAIIDIVKHLYDDVYNKGNLALCDEIFTTNLRHFDSGYHESTGGLAHLKEKEKGYRKAFPDKKTTIDDIFAVDNKVVVRWHCQGTHKGYLKEIPPTNKPFKISGISIYKFNNQNKIEEAWQSWDRLALLEQIGETQHAQVLH